MVRLRMIGSAAGASKLALWIGLATSCARPIDNVPAPPRRQSLLRQRCLQFRDLHGRSLRLATWIILRTAAATERTERQADAVQSSPHRPER